MFDSHIFFFATGLFFLVKIKTYCKQYYTVAYIWTYVTACSENNATMFQFIRGSDCRNLVWDTSRVCGTDWLVGKGDILHGTEEYASRCFCNLMQNKSNATFGQKDRVLNIRCCRLRAARNSWAAAIREMSHNGLPASPIESAADILRARRQSDSPSIPKILLQLLSKDNNTVCSPFTPHGDFSFLQTCQNRWNKNSMRYFYLLSLRSTLSAKSCSCWCRIGCSRR